MIDNRLYLANQPLITTNKPGNKAAGAAAGKPVHAKVPFDQVLNRELTEVKFSQHALERMNSRNIKLNEADLNKLNHAVEKAEQKGARESLILINDTALVVSVKNKTVITAMDGASMKENVFTNIDSAVIV